MLYLHMPSIPDAYQAAARLGCPEAFAIVDDKRSSVRTIWLAEQLGTDKYALREVLGRGRLNDELNDPFAKIYLQACETNVQWLCIEPECPDGSKEIQDGYGSVIVHKVLLLTEKYTKGIAMSEASLASKSLAAVVLVVVVDDSGAEVASSYSQVEDIDK